MPGRDDTAGDGFANSGNFYFNGHTTELRKLIERRGRSAFRQHVSHVSYGTYPTRTQQLKPKRASSATGSNITGLLGAIPLLAG